MDAPCEIQGSIHVFRLVNNMCPGKWVHIRLTAFSNRVYVLNYFLFWFVNKVYNEFAVFYKCSLDVVVAVEF